MMKKSTRKSAKPKRIRASRKPRTEKRKPCAQGKHQFTRLYNEGQNCINCGERAKSYGDYSIAEARALGFFDE